MAGGSPYRAACATTRRPRARSAPRRPCSMCWTSCGSCACYARCDCSCATYRARRACLPVSYTHLRAHETSAHL
eukprot:10436878-Alexandrium_andersonii.AAC.1